MSPDTAKAVLGAGGTTFAILMFLAPAKTFRTIVMDKDTHLYSVVPYLSTLNNCVVWVLYALVTPDRLQPLICNVVGVALQSIYIVLFGMYTRDRKLFLKQLAATLGFAGVVILLTFGVVPIVKADWLAGDTAKKQSDFLGIVADVLNTIAYGSPLVVMKTVIKTKSVAAMPFLLSLTVLLCSSFWTGYSLVCMDYFIMVPNVAGVLLGVAQLVLYAMYYGDSKDITSVKDPLISSEDDDDLSLKEPTV
eukprot:GFYU01037338.1.p1 GENE.GFYU01037338.1~~GFYU01037338.1.p1  ORF type:complete len:249 (-),score=50.26 GFYU01037338.1:60-806(-)